MNNTQFNAEYLRLLTRYNELFDMQRTWREQQEFEAINRQLEAQEVGTVRAIVNDYDETMQLYEVGNLGGVEL